jgi:hypothetical protein
VQSIALRGCAAGPKHTKCINATVTSLQCECEVFARLPSFRPIVLCLTSGESKVPNSQMSGKATALTAFAALVEEQQRSVWSRTTAMIVPAGLKTVVTEATSKERCAIVRPLNGPYGPPCCVFIRLQITKSYSIIKFCALVGHTLCNLT